MGTGQSLPVRMFLLAHDLGKDKVSDKAWLDHVVQGAALARLLVDGLLTDTGAAVVSAAGEPPAN